MSHDAIGIAGLAGLRDHVLSGPEPRGFAPGPDGPRVEHLVVARESDEFDLQLLDGMVRQTLARYAVPGRDELVALGVDPVRDPSAHGAWVVEAFRTRAVLFERSGTWCLYSQGSAAKADANGDNGFCMILEQVFRELRPVNVYLATFSRLVRNVEFSGRIMAAARRHVEVIRCPEMTIEPANPSSGLLFSFLSGFSDMERRQQMTRLMLGLVHKHDRGEWWRGPQAVPLGYRLDGKRAVPDPRARHVVRALLRLLAEGPTAASAMADLAGLGVAAPSQTGAGWAYLPENGGDWGPDGDDLRGALRTAGGRTVASLSDPKGMLAKFYRHLSVYADGTLASPHESPIEGVTRFGGHPVVKGGTAERPRWFVDLTFRLGVPDGGWGPPDLVQAALSRAAEVTARSRGPLASRSLLPLLARPARWTADGRLHQVGHGRGHSDAYSLLSIDAEKAAAMGPSRPGRAFDGWDRGGTFHGRVDGRADACELHASIAQAAADAFENGVAAQALPVPRQWPDPGPARRPGAGPAEQVAALAAAATAAAAAADAAARKYSLYSGPDLGHDRRLREQAEAASADAAAAAARHDQALAGLDGTVPPPSAPRLVSAPADLLLQTLAELGRTAGPVSREAAAATGRIVQGLRMEADPVWIRWTAELHVPSSDSVVVIGPIGGRVRNRHRGERLPDGARGHGNRAGRREDRDRALLRAVLTDDRPVASLADRPGEHGKKRRQRLVQVLADDHRMDRRAAQLLLLCPVPATRRAVWDLLNGREPAGVSPGFAGLLRAAYLSEDRPAQTSWWQRCADRGPAIALLEAAGGSVLACQAKRLFRDGGLPDTAVYDLTTGARGRPFLQRIPGPGGGCCRSRTCRGDVLALHRCPSCGGHATLTARVPECPLGVLCAPCLRMPVPGSPQFPGDYGLLDDAWVHARHADVAPDIPLYREKYRARAARRQQPPVPEPALARRRPAAERAAARAWAAANGVALRPNRPVPDWVFDRWEHDARRARSGPGARTDAALRAWARTAGYAVPARGRLPQSAWDAYGVACASHSDPCAVRE
jgi:hypothetical protein